MATIPSKLADKLSFFEQHLPVWAEDPAAIGLSAIQVSDMATIVANARSAFDAAQAARASSRAATTTQTNAFDAMTDFGADLIKTIRAFAETTNDPDVYAAAQIPPPTPPTPAGPPEVPTGLAARLLTPFGLGLTWKGSAAQGTYFGVWRQLEGEAEFTLIGTSKTKSYEDRTIPAGTAGIIYYITAYRDEFSVNSNMLTVRFGAGGTTSTTLGLAA